MLISIMGLAGSGKDETANILVKHHNFVRIAFADPIKRILKDVFDFDDQQLWGPSNLRNEPVYHYPRGEDDFLSVRYALQGFGTVGRNCFKDIWVDYVIRIYKKLQTGKFYYDIKHGLCSCSNCDYTSSQSLDLKTNVVISDCRFQNEFDAMKKAGAFMIRIIRPGSGLSGETANHESETEQTTISDDCFDAILYNSGSLEDLKGEVFKIIKLFGKK